MEEGSLAKALNDFFTVTEGEISLCKGDVVQVLKRIDKYWWYGVCAGKSGNVPEIHLISLDTPLLEENEELFVAYADFPGQQEGDLSFRKGDLIAGVCQVNENWWHGKIGSRNGIFPTTHTWKVDSRLLKARMKPKNTHMKARVKTNLKAQLDEEMDLYKGDIVTVTEIIDKNWYRGHCGNQSGVFPSGYVEIIEGDENKPSESCVLPDVELPVFTGSKPLYDDVDSLLTISPEAKFSSTVLPEAKFSSTVSPEAKSPSTSATLSADNSINDSSIFSDDYFKVNMPSMYLGDSKQADNSVSQVDVTNHSAAELDIVPYGITLYPFYAQFENELGFHEGEIVKLIRHIDRDWIEGKIDDKKGIFPTDYVNIIVDCEKQASFPPNSCRSNINESYNTAYETASELMPDTFAMVLYNFDAQMEGDLTVHEGEVVKIVKKVNVDWFEVKNQSGNIGLCPQNYISSSPASSDARNKLTRGHSLQTQSLLIDSSFDVRSQDICKTNNISNDWGKHKCEKDDFPAVSSYSVKRESNIEDLISKNLDNLSLNTPNSCNMHWNQREELEKLAVCAVNLTNEEEPEQRKEGSPELCRTCTAEAVPHTAPSHPPPPKPPDDDTSEEVFKVPSFVEKGTIELHHKAKEQTIRYSLPCYPEFKRQVPLRKSSDRVPHRPAPPVPVPGQQPIRRYLKLDRKQTSDFSENITAEEGKEACADSGKQRNTGAAISEYKANTLEEQRRKNAEQRQNVISELVYTEKEYVRDLKITYETYNLHNPHHLEERGIDWKVVFGNILEVMKSAEDLLDRLQLAMKGKDEADQCVGQCFLEMADQMKTVYGQYCMNHNNALLLLEKYGSNEDIQRLFNKGLETLRYQIACFDMGSILIKPVQRILKYPLILNELIKCTDDSHKDKADLLKAVKAMMDVATYINEYKRRQDIVTKYLEDGNMTISSKMSRLTLHSVAKKSTRFGIMLTSTLFGAATKDPLFDEQEQMFHTIEKTVRNLMRNVAIFVNALQEEVASQFSVAVAMKQYYQEKSSEADDYQRIQHLIYRQLWSEFKRTIEERVLLPLNTLLELFEGPAILIQKRHDKLLDYEGCCAKAEKNKENRLIQEELAATKCNYEALNSHLIEELPMLNSASCELLVECLSAFVAARKLFSGKNTKQYLALMETPLMKAAQGDAIESFAVRHSLAFNQITRFSLFDGASKRASKSSPTPPSKQMDMENPAPEKQAQSPGQRTYLQSKYSSEMLYVTTQAYTASETLELNVAEGHLVAVIKKQNPMGDTNLWFVDAGSTQGFLPKSILQAVFAPSPSTSPRPERQQSQIKHTSPAAQHRERVEEAPPPAYEEVVNEPALQLHQEYEYVSELDTACGSEEARDTFFYTLYDFDGGEHTLSLRRGQVVNVLHQQDRDGNSEWWYVEDRYGRKGFVPANFLQKYQPISEALLL